MVCSHIWTLIVQAPTITQTNTYKSVSLLFTITAVYIVCWMQLWLHYAGLSVPVEIFGVLLLNSVVNPFIYSVVSALFRSDDKIVFRQIRASLAAHALMRARVYTHTHLPHPYPPTHPPHTHCTILHYTMLCYAMLCYAMLCYAMLCYAMLCYAMLCYAMLCYAMLCYAMLCYAMLCDAMLCYAMLCYAMLCYAMLCYAMI